MSFEKEMQIKAEEEIKIILEETRKRLEFISRENIEIKQAAESYKHETREMIKALRESESRIDTLQRNLKIKEDIIKEFQKNISITEKDPRTTSLKHIKAQTNKLDIKRLEMTEKRAISDSPERKNLQLSDRANDSSHKSMLIEAMKLANAQSPKDFFEKISIMKQEIVKCKKIRKLIDKISDMIVQCSPSGSFNKEPSTHQIWKWLTRLLEEYMKLKQSISGESFNKLCKILGTDSIDEMIEKIEKTSHLQNSKSRGPVRGN